MMRIFFLFDIAELIILGLALLHRKLFSGTLEILNNWCSSGLHCEDFILNTTILIILALVGR